MRILILAKDFAPLNVIAAKRPAAWYNHWKKAGIEVIVVTSTASNNVQDEAVSDIIRVKPSQMGDKGFINKIIRKIRSSFEIWLPFIWPSTSRYYSIYKAADRILKKESFDFIIATAEPFILFAFASQLSKKFQIPWCADYRDNWSNNPLANASRKLHRTWLQKFFSKVEQKWLSNARIITTASPSYSAKVADLLKKREMIFDVLNGHDVDFIVDPPKADKVFTIVYAGRFYAFQPIEEFLEVLQEVFPDSSAIRIDFLGLADWPEQVDRVKQAAGNIIEKTTFHKGLPYGEYIKLLAEAHCMILLSKENMAWLNAKIFDYIAMKGAICQFYGNDGVLAPILQQQDGAFIAQNKEELRNHLMDIFNLYQQKQINFNRNAAAFSRAIRAEEMLNLLKQHKDVN